MMIGWFGVIKARVLGMIVWEMVIVAGSTSALTSGDATFEWPGS